MRVLLLALGLWLAAPPSTPGVIRCVPTIPAGDPVSELRRWSKLGPQSEVKQLVKVEQALRELERDWASHESRRLRIQTAWLDFLGRCLRIEDEVAEDPQFRTFDSERGKRGEGELRRRVTISLVSRLPELHSWLVQDVLLTNERQPEERRTAACEVLRHDESEGGVLALLRSTRSASRELLDAAIGALEGRALPEVHVRLIELLAQADAGELELWRWPIERHFRALELAEGETGVVAAVAAYVVAALPNEDWRIASRAVSIGRCLPNAAVFPALVQGLEVWLARSPGEARGVRRVQGELLEELRRRSGRSLGPHPDRWAKLWAANQGGDANFVGEGEEGERITQAGFFGLRPETDWVVFVLDRSGSMDVAFGGDSSHTRLEEAADQLASYLTQLGPRTRFNVIVFSDSIDVWHRELQLATEDHVEKAKKWVLSGGDRAGTQLRPAVLEALHIDRRGKQDTGDLEADTIIVLCDGSTAEGSDWVVPLMRRVGDASRIVFHAVQIGAEGDGTLEALCASTGGDFVFVEG